MDRGDVLGHRGAGALDAADRAAPPGPAPADPAGEDFDFGDDEQMRARLPRLAAIYRPVE
ncbi:hypothetical protein CSH63_14910 [Micromonospora tulbaghiae]|uniref:Uncharacterized protein n=1 Tax=Micromonospora tulbaghiae TaxID=479978 RepID=A0A386WKL4_9ACTN|nr:hypothetical protein [Micromonospora tulbaghiae]AYF28721.1 hypothetical protein CSH63_14910 [Micromonospora tulbaghiae]